MRCSRLQSHLVLCALLALLAAPATLATEPAATTLFDEPACSFAATDSLEIPGLTPAPLLRVGCDAEQNCPNGTKVTCSGQHTCLVGSNYVECDGNRTYCSATCSGSPFCAPEDQQAYCDCIAAGYSDFRCRQCACFDECGPINP